MEEEHLYTDITSSVITVEKLVTSKLLNKDERRFKSVERPNEGKTNTRLIYECVQLCDVLLRMRYLDDNVEENHFNKWVLDSAADILYLQGSRHI